MGMAPGTAGGMLRRGWPLGGTGAQQEGGPPPALALRRRVEALITAALARVRRQRSAHAEAALRIEARVALGPKRSVALIACRGRYFLAASAGEQMAPLIEVPPVEVPPVEEARPRPVKKRNGGKQNERKQDHGRRQCI